MNSIRIGKANKSLDKVLLEIFLHGIKSVQPKTILSNYIYIKNNQITVKDKSKTLTYKRINKVFIICVGKASTDMAITAKKILSKSKLKISKGIVVVNKENFKKIPGFDCFFSGHPIPNKNGLKASTFVKEYLKNSTKNDLVLIFISGGGSALLPLPVEDVSLNEKIEINRFLINSGANIKEINTVRKHLSQIKGGNLMKFCAPSKVHCFILSDVIGDDLSSIASGVSVPDNTTFNDAKKILLKYNLWKKIPRNANKYIDLGTKNKNPETPKEGDPVFKNVKNTLIGSNLMCLEVLKNYCKKKKIECTIWKKNIESDVQELAKTFASDLNEKQIKKPVILISGGESTVNIKGKGKGGRNQEFALHLAKEIKKNNSSLKYTLLSAGTDGKDGPTNAAGAIVNQNSINLIEQKGINLNKELDNNNSYEVLQKINSLVIIDGTNTNGADIQLLALI